MAARQRKFRSAQGALPFHRNGRWGGARPGAGRKPLPPGVRAKLASRFPVHTTVRLRTGLPALRNRKVYKILRDCFLGAGAREGFRPPVR